MSHPDDTFGQIAALADIAPTILWISDASGGLRFISRRWQECTGQATEAALDDGWVACVQPDQAQHVQAVLQAAAAKREAFAVDYRLRHADGAYRWVSASGRPHCGPGADFLGFIGTVVDIDDRKRAELALRRTQQAARFLANASMALADMSDPRSALGKVASLAVPFFADWCAVDLVSEDGGLERLVVVHSEPRKAGLAQEIARRWLPDTDDPVGAGQGGPHRRAGDRWRTCADARAPRRGPATRSTRGVLQELGFASYICVPVRLAPPGAGRC